MHHQIPIGAFMLAVVLGVTVSDARAFDEAKYPNWKGQWLRSDTGIPAPAPPDRLRQRAAARRRAARARLVAPSPRVATPPLRRQGA